MSETQPTSKNLRVFLLLLSLFSLSDFFLFIFIPSFSIPSLHPLFSLSSFHSLFFLSSSLLSFFPSSSLHSILHSLFSSIVPSHIFSPSVKKINFLSDGKSYPSHPPCTVIGCPGLGLSLSLLLSLSLSLSLLLSVMRDEFFANFLPPRKTYIQIHLLQFHFQHELLVWSRSLLVFFFHKFEELFYKFISKSVLLK